MQGPPGDGLAVVDDLADDGGLGLAGEAAELGGGLGVAPAGADAAGPGLEGEDVAGAAQVGGLRGGCGEDAAGQGAVVGRDARGDGGVGGVDAHGVGGAAGVLGAGDHLGQEEVGGAGGGEGRADEARRVPDHEAHLLRRHRVGGDDEVRLVLARGVVEDYEEFAITWNTRPWGRRSVDRTDTTTEGGRERRRGKVLC